MKDYTIGPKINDKSKITFHSDNGIIQFVNDYNKWHPDEPMDLNEARNGIVIQPRN